MNILDVIEKAVGSEYFSNKSSELYVAMQQSDLSKAVSLNKHEQPNSNKIVLLK